MQKKFCRGLLSLALTGIALLAYAQNPLKIGDALPKQFWKTPLQMVNTPQKTTTLAADKDKLILLDFWNTWCSACILNFPKMEELQKQFGDKIKILAVSNQDRTTLEKFFASKNGSKYNQVQSVAADKMMHNLFPHLGVPFIIWIKDGKLLSTTDARQVSTETLTAVLAEKPAVLQTVTQMNRDRPLFLSEAFDRQKKLSMLNYSVLIRGRIPDIGGGGTYRKSPGGRTYGRQFTNLPLNDIYYALAYEIFQQKYNDFYSEKRMLLQVSNVADVKPQIDSERKFDDNSLYSYEMAVPYSDADSLYTNMLSGLNSYTNFTATIEKRKIKCLRLVRTASQDRIATKGGSRVSAFYKNPSVLRNAPLQHMINMLNGDNTITDLPVVDETGYTGNVDITMPAVSNLAALRKELSRYGLDLLEGEQLLNMLVVRDRNQPNHL
ncbi:Thiol-disulfide isomerase or thioredoxin [Epilithonimonas bovis DSM 19482]|uniref:Thiol-disulfide isomerase or thioredoxin n=1 Tax=Epilithonimonas bovis DSM 19482 TaxID=1121284 RepID=A0A1U7Q030_9FLAO|nr:redoxin domain-containing protein [Epilithonimonas bovis]SIT97722.1 Thiol-disulfide isomerase or thioredoxin [Epilithonimonas bovis DSM 19482]